MTLPEFIYTVVLRPPPLKKLANRVLRAIIPQMLQRNGAKIVLNPGDPVVSGALTFGVYELAETEFFLSACRAGMTFLDVGANIGYYTALAMNCMQGRGRIIALEPDPENFFYLKQTVAANGEGQVTCVQKAASDHEGMMTLYTSSNNRGDNRLYNNQLTDGKCQVEVTTIDGLLGELSVPALDLIKMDVQGYEGHVLAGLHDTIRQSPQLTLLSEFWPQGLRDAGSDPEVFLADLKVLDFQIFELQSKCQLIPMTDPAGLIARYSGRKYTNVVAVKGDEAIKRIARN